MIRGRMLRAVAFLVTAAALILLTVSLTILLMSGSGAAHVTGDVTLDLIATVVYLPHIAAGAFLAVRFPQHAIGWIVLIPAFGSVLQSLAGRAILYTHQIKQDPVLSTEILAVAGDALWIPTAALGLICLLVLYPDGRPATRWAKWILWTMGVVAFIYVMITLLVRAPLYYLPTVPNPLGLFGDPILFEVGQSASSLAVGLVGLPAGIVALVVRWRRADQQVRGQIKWLFWAALIYVVGVAGSIIGSEVVEGPVQGGWTGALTDIGGMAFPIAIVIAITRYRLYEIDRIVSRTVSYAVIALVLGAVYVGGVLAAQTVLPASDDLGVAASTLVAAATFSPLRRRVQRWVDRRFNRSKYDAERVIESFTGSLRDRVDADIVVDGWVEVVSETMQPSAVSAWVRA